MAGHCRIYLTEFDAGIASMEAANELARQVGDRHGEMFSLESQGLLLAFGARYEESEPVLERALALATSLGARRYQAVLLTVLGEVSLSFGRTAEAHDRNEQALLFARETGMRFIGPFILALKARWRATRSSVSSIVPKARRLSTKEASGIARSVITASASRTRWRAASGKGRARMQRRSSPTRATSRLPYTDFLIARGRVLAALGANPQEAAARGELERLKADALRLKWPIGWHGH